MLDERSEDVVNVDNQFNAAPSLNLDSDGDKNSEVQSNVQSPKLKGNENNSDPIFQEPMVSNYDETSSIVTQSRCADSIHSQV